MDRFQKLRILEASLFAAKEPLNMSYLEDRLGGDENLPRLLDELQSIYANRGVNLKKIGNGWAFRTAEDLGEYMTLERMVPKKLSRAGMETLAIIAYHQPVTRAEIEDIRAVATSKGTLDLLLEAQWIKPKGRRRTPGKPITWGTTDQFLDQFGLDAIDTLPGMDDLKAAGLLDTRPGLGSLAMRADELEPVIDDAVEDTDNQEELFDLEHDFVAYDKVENDEDIALED